MDVKIADCHRAVCSNALQMETIPEEYKWFTVTFWSAFRTALAVNLYVAEVSPIVRVSSKPPMAWACRHKSPQTTGQ